MKIEKKKFFDLPNVNFCENPVKRKKIMEILPKIAKIFVKIKNST